MPHAGPGSDVTEVTQYCPRCRYDLFGLVSPRCPECGNTLNRAVIPFVPRGFLRISWAERWASLLPTIGLFWAAAVWWHWLATGSLRNSSNVGAQLLLVPSYLLVSAVPRRGIPQRVFVIACVVALWSPRRIFGLVTFQPFIVWHFLALLLPSMIALLIMKNTAWAIRYLAGGQTVVAEGKWLRRWYRGSAVMVSTYAAGLWFWPHHPNSPAWGQPWWPLGLLAASVWLARRQPNLHWTARRSERRASLICIAIQIAMLCWCWQVIRWWHVPTWMHG